MHWVRYLLILALLPAGCMSGLPETQTLPWPEQSPSQSEHRGSYDLVSAQDRSRVRWTVTVGGVARVGVFTQVVGGLHKVGEDLDGASGVISANLRYVETGEPLWDQQISESFFEVLLPGKEKVHDWAKASKRAKRIEWTNLRKGLGACDNQGERIFAAYEYIAEPFLPEDYRTDDDKFLNRASDFDINLRQMISDSQFVKPIGGTGIL